MGWGGKDLRRIHVKMMYYHIVQKINQSNNMMYSKSANMTVEKHQRSIQVGYHIIGQINKFVYD